MLDRTVLKWAISGLGFAGVPNCSLPTARFPTARFHIDFHNLFCIANMPIARYAVYLKRNKQLAEYHKLLVESFNPASIDNLICRDTISVDWQGRVFDCDFNQQLDMQLANGKPLDIWDIDIEKFSAMPIITGSHCFGCTAGSGSSCGGALVELN